MQIEKGQINTLIVFDQPSDPTVTRYLIQMYNDFNCIDKRFIVENTSNNVCDLELIFAESDLEDLLNGIVSLFPGNWNLKVYEQPKATESTNLDITLATLMKEFNTKVVGDDCDISGSLVSCPPVVVTDSDEVTIVQVPAGGSFECTPGGAPSSGILYDRGSLFTGQTTQYAMYDEGWHRANGTYAYTPPANPATVAQLDITAARPHFTLKSNNTFGNLDRFTDDASGQTYANSLVIDHLTGLMWYPISIQSFNWTTTLSNTNSNTTGGFTNWRVPNRRELDTILLRNASETNQVLNYAPFNWSLNSSSLALWCSTTDQNNTGNSFRQILTNYTTFAKTSSLRVFICRTHLT